MKKKIKFWLSCVSILLVCFCVTLSAEAASTEEEVLQVETDWIKAFNTMDFELMSSLYRHSPETTSFSPNSSILYQGWETIESGLKEYFKSPVGTYSWTMDNVNVTVLKADIAVITGKHVVIDRPEGKEPMTGSHVFSRVLQKIDGKWLIVHEHESHIPR